MTTRRDFIKRSGMALVATSLLPHAVLDFTKAHKIGLQLYSLRDFIGKDVPGTIKKLGELGIQEVETYGYSAQNQFWGHSIADFNKMLKGAGITTPSGHYGVDSFLKKGGSTDEIKFNIDAASELGQEYLIAPAMGGDLRKNADDYKRLGDKFNEAGELCKASGLKFAYHNHAFEFDDMGGKSGLEILLENIDKKLVTFEMDIYWVVRGGYDPVEMMKKYPKRFELWHVKDMSKTNHEHNTEIGSGTIDYKEIFDNRNTSGVKHLIIEQENFDMDPYKSLAQSIKYINNYLL